MKAATESSSKSKNDFYISTLAPVGHRRANWETIIAQLQGERRQQKDSLRVSLRTEASRKVDRRREDPLADHPRTPRPRMRYLVRSLAGTRRERRNDLYRSCHY